MRKNPSRLTCLFWCFVVVPLVCAVGIVLQNRNKKPGEGQQTIQVGAIQRSYYLHVSTAYTKDRATALVLVFHGGGGNGKGMEDITGFSALADQKGFIVVYPDGQQNRWRGQPETTPDDIKANDIGFISTLIASLSRTYTIDPKRVYATGISNGGVFSNRLACELSGKIAAIGAVAGSLSANEQTHCTAKPPISVLQFHGTKDPIIPFNGGTIRTITNSEKILSAPDTISFWRQVNSCSTIVQTSKVPHMNSEDTTTASLDTATQCQEGAEVILYTIVGGGHTWPGSSQYLPESLIGKTNRDMNATEMIWDFFEHHPKL